MGEYDYLVQHAPGLVNAVIDDLELLTARTDAPLEAHRILGDAYTRADRLAEALAERMHERVRRELWGYAPDEHLDNQALIREQYQGIRPAPGYPACPDHTEKRILFDLLEVEDATGITLTENFAMLPAASICGLYFAHKESRYFAVSAIGRDQVEAYAARKGMLVSEIERWLSPVLGYDPGRVSKGASP